MHFEITDVPVDLKYRSKYGDILLALESLEIGKAVSVPITELGETRLENFRSHISGLARLRGIKLQVNHRRGSIWIQKVAHNA